MSSPFNAQRFQAVAIGLFISLSGCSFTEDERTASSADEVAAKPASLSESQPAEIAADVHVSSQSPVAVPGKIRQAEQKQKAEARSQVSRRARAPMAEAEADYAGEMAFVAQPYSGLVHHYSHEPQNRENYQTIVSNPVKRVEEEPVSTFSVDVDTGSYSNVRRMLQQGIAVRHDAVRVEELINYFDYDYPVPHSRHQPFSVTTEVGPNPWNDKTRLLHIGLQGYEVAAEEIPAANLVFLVDVSGSMGTADKLGLLKSSLKLLTRRLDADDRVAIAVYAGASGLVLDSTPGNEGAKIASALDRLAAGGSTNGGAGIQLAYSVAEQHFIKGGVNRVILATDGDFNVGTVNQEALIDLIEQKRESGISLTTLGFGSGNYNDHLMEQLADKGNGNYAYIDTLNEANKTLVNEMSSTLFTIAKDVKIQIEFNPEVVTEYRLIGYENRVLNREDFNNDKIDAGDIGAGHSVTALYEIALIGEGGERIEPLRYGQSEKRRAPGPEIAFLKLRYKQPDSDVSTLIDMPIRRADLRKRIAETTDNYRFSAAVAAFGQILRGAEYTGDYSLDKARKLAIAARGKDPFGYRGELAGLIDLSEGLQPVAKSAHGDATVRQ